MNSVEFYTFKCIVFPFLCKYISIWLLLLLVIYMFNNRELRNIQMREGTELETVAVQWLASCHSLPLSLLPRPGYQGELLRFSPVYNPLVISCLSPTFPFLLFFHGVCTLYLSYRDTNFDISLKEKENYYLFPLYSIFVTCMMWKASI